MPLPSCLTSSLPCTVQVLPGIAPLDCSLTSKPVSGGAQTQTGTASVPGVGDRSVSKWVRFGPRRVHKLMGEMVSYDTLLYIDVPVLAPVPWNQHLPPSPFLSLVLSKHDQSHWTPRLPMADLPLAFDNLPRRKAVVTMFTGSCCRNQGNTQNPTAEGGEAAETEDLPPPCKTLCFPRPSSRLKQLSHLLPGPGGGSNI